MIFNLNIRKTQPILLAALALSVAVYTATPAYGSSSKASKDLSSKNSDVHYGTSAPEGQSPMGAASGFQPDTTLSYKNLHPGVNYYLTDLVLYNSHCQEITPGSWSGTEPSYGVVTQGYVYGHLSNGACHGVTFKFRAIYYRWTHDKYATHDQFKAHWSGAGYKTNTITFKLGLKY